MSENLFLQATLNKDFKERISNIISLKETVNYSFEEDYLNKLDELARKSFQKEIIFYQILGFKPPSSNNFENYINWIKANFLHENGESLYYRYLTFLSEKQNDGEVQSRKVWIEILNELTTIDFYNLYVNSGFKKTKFAFLDSQETISLDITEQREMLNNNEEAVKQQIMKKIKDELAKYFDIDYFNDSIQKTLKVKSKEEDAKKVQGRKVEDILIEYIIKDIGNLNKNILQINNRYFQQILEQYVRDYLSSNKVNKEQYSNYEGKIGNSQIRFYEQAANNGLMKTKNTINLFLDQGIGVKQKVILDKSIGKIGKITNISKKDVQKWLLNKGEKKSLKAINSVDLQRFFSDYKISTYVEGEKIYIECKDKEIESLKTYSIEMTNWIIKVLTAILEQRKKKRENKGDFLFDKFDPKEEKTQEIKSLKDKINDLKDNPFFSLFREELAKVIEINAREYLYLKKSGRYYKEIKIPSNSNRHFEFVDWNDYISKSLVRYPGTFNSPKNEGTMHEMIFSAIMKAVPNIKDMKEEEQYKLAGQEKNLLNQDLFSDGYIKINGQKIGFQLKAKKLKEEEEFYSFYGDEHSIFGKGLTTWLKEDEIIKLRGMSLLNSDKQYVLKELNSYFGRLTRLEDSFSDDFMNNFFVINFKLIPTSLILLGMKKHFIKNKKLQIFNLDNFFYQDENISFKSQNVGIQSFTPWEKLDESQIKNILKKDETITYKNKTYSKFFKIETGIYYSHDLLKETLNEIKMFLG